MKDGYNTKFLDHYFEELRSDIKEIKTQTIRTNGRVGNLESELDSLKVKIYLIGAVAGTVLVMKFPEIFEVITKFV